MREFSQDIAVILHEALLNEICLDRRYVQVFRPQGNFLHYKVMRQVALEQRLGPFLKPVLLIAAWIMPAVILLRWFSALAKSIWSDACTIDRVVWIIATVDANATLISDGLAKADVIEPPRILGDLASQLPRLMGFQNVLAICPAILKLLWLVLTVPRGPRSTLLLHARDAVEFLLLARFARQHSRDIFATECHYQRWSFVLSHCANQLILVQHGQLDSQIDFPCRGGNVKIAVVRDESSALSFRRYFRQIKHVRVHVPKVRLQPASSNVPAIFLASSFPTIDQEIAFVLALRQRQAPPLIVKLHPAHLYDQRGTELLNLASFKARRDENPECIVFISHSSSMESIYRAHGIRTVSLVQQPSTLAAVEAVLIAVSDYYQSINQQK
jgi:hypothetical protein